MLIAQASLVAAPGKKFREPLSTSKAKIKSFKGAVIIHRVTPDESVDGISDRELLHNYYDEIEKRNLKKQENCEASSQFEEYCRLRPCPICIGPLGSFQAIRQISVLQCGHLFCRKCIALLQDPKCPVCRRDKKISVPLLFP